MMNENDTIIVGHKKNKMKNKQKHKHIRNIKNERSFLIHIYLIKEYLSRDTSDLKYHSVLLGQLLALSKDDSIN